ncbi:MAG: hypothetical protein QXU32_02270 [Nitrososphaerales archaeon]
MAEEYNGKWTNWDTWFLAMIISTDPYAYHRQFTDHGRRSRFEHWVLYEIIGPINNILIEEARSFKEQAIQHVEESDIEEIERWVPPYIDESKIDWDQLWNYLVGNESNIR